MRSDKDTMKTFFLVYKEEEIRLREVALILARCGVYLPIYKSVHSIIECWRILVLFVQIVDPLGTVPFQILLNL